MGEFIKAFWQAIESNWRIRLSLAIGSTIFLFSREYIVSLPNGDKTYSFLAIFVLFVAIISGTTVVVDIGAWLYEKAKNKIEHREFESYILNLNDEKMFLVQKVYNDLNHASLLRTNDTNVRELMAKKVIQPALKENVIDAESNDPEIYFILTIKALNVIEKHRDRFIFKPDE